MGLRKSPEKLSLNYHTQKNLKWRASKKGNDALILKAKRNLTQGKIDSRKAVRKLEGFENLPASEQEKLMKEAEDAFVQRQIKRKRHPDYLELDEEEVYSWEQLGDDSDEEEANGDMDLDMSGDCSDCSGSEALEEEEQANAEFATKSQILAAEMEHKAWSKLKSHQAGTNLSILFRVTRNAWRSVSSVLTKKLKRLENLKDSNLLFEILPAGQKMLLHERFGSDQLSSLSPLQFFTTQEISFLQNRFACSQLNRLPGEKSWWKAYPEELKSVESGLPDPGLAKEAFELMFGPSNKTFYRIIAMDIEGLRMKNGSVVDFTDADPRLEIGGFDMENQLKDINFEIDIKAEAVPEVVPDLKVDGMLDNVMQTCGEEFDSGEDEDDILNDPTLMEFMAPDDDDDDDDNGEE